MAYEQKLIDGITAVLVAQGALAQTEVGAIHSAFSATDVERFEEFLIDEDIVTKQALLQALQTYYKLSAVDVVGMLLQHNLVITFPKEIMLQYGFVPYQLDGDILYVIAARPQDPVVDEQIGNYVSYDIVFLVGLYSDITDAVKEFYDEALTMIHEDEDDELEEDYEEIIDEE